MGNKRTAGIEIKKAIKAMGYKVKSARKTESCRYWRVTFPAGTFKLAPLTVEESADRWEVKKAIYRICKSASEKHGVYMEDVLMSDTDGFLL